jgi:hypothetical protein
MNESKIKRKEGRRKSGNRAKDRSSRAINKATSAERREGQRYGQALH